MMTLACTMCGKAAHKACGDCNDDVPYCSEDCQRLDWMGRHEILCAAKGAVEESSSSSLGKSPRELTDAYLHAEEEALEDTGRSLEIPEPLSLGPEYKHERERKEPKRERKREHKRVSAHVSGHVHGLTRAKARIILHDKEVRGHPLTDRQRRFFGWVAGGSKPYSRKR